VQAGCKSNGKTFFNKKISHFFLEEFLPAARPIWLVCLVLALIPNL
jgi:hypothetical protein